MTAGAGDADLRAALDAERAGVGASASTVRIAAVAAWGALALGIGLAGRPEWLVPLPILGAWLAIAVALRVAARRAWLRRRLWLAVPCLDLPLVCATQLWFLSVSTRPEAVATFTVGILAWLVFVSQLSFSRRGIALTLAGALACSALVLWRAGLPLPNLLAAAVVLGSAAAIAVFTGTRIEALVAVVAEARRARELARAERMASVAALVSGIAHELNNPIGYIAGNVPHLQRYTRFLSEVAGALADGRPRSPAELAALTRLDGTRDVAYVAADLASIVADIADGARRAALIVGDLQSLTSGAGRAVETVDLGRAIEQTRALFAGRLPAAATLAIDAAQVPAVRARAGQLEQVLVNLVDNARRAIGEGGAVRIRLAAAGEGVVLEVQDDGCGMTAEQRARACEPFFTTRDAGEGAGLGLAIVASIVAGHGGELAIASAAGTGTTVTVRLPLAGA